MKSDTLNTILNVVLAIFVITIIFCSWRAVSLVHKARNLQQPAMQANQVLSKTQGLLAELDAYNRHSPSQEITQILKSFEKPATH